MNRNSPEEQLLEDLLPCDRFDQATTREAVTVQASEQVYFAPLHYEPNYAYPLLVWLHGEGENEQSLKRIVPQVSMRNYVAVAPRGTVELPAGNFEDSEERFGWCQSESHIFAARKRILAAVEQASSRFHTHPGRVFLCGVGTGGTMAFRVAMSDPEHFHGVLSLGGMFPIGHTPLVHLHRARRVPLFMSTSRHSDTYPQSTVCDNLRLLHTAGMMVTLRQYPGDENLNKAILADVDRWIMETIASDQQTAVVAS